MAENKSLMTEINKHARNIDRNTKHFGPKLPSGNKKEEDLTLQEISYTQMIMGSLASMVWGVKNINRSERVRNLLNKPNIFELMNGISSKLDKEYSLLQQLYNKDNSSNTVKSITSNTNRILDSINTLSKIILTNYKQNSVDELDEFEDKVNNSINSVIKSNKELIENTDTGESNIDLSSVIASLKNIDNSIDNINDTINTNTTRLLASLGLIASIDKDTSDVITNNVINTDNSVTNNSVNNTNNTSNNINNVDNTSNNVVNNNVSNISTSIETNTDEIVDSVNGITASLENQGKHIITLVSIINNVTKSINNNIDSNTTRLLASLGLIASIDKDTSDVITNNVINTDNSVTNNSVNNTNNTSNNINNVDNTSNNVVNNNVSNISTSIETNTDEIVDSVNGITASLENQGKHIITLVSIINNVTKSINDTINSNTTRLLASLGLIASIDKDTSDIITNNVINTDNSVTNNSVNNTNNTSNNINNVDNTSNNVVNNNVSNIPTSIETNTDEIVGSVNGITTSLENQNKTYIQYINNLFNNVIQCLNDNTSNIIESLDNDIIQLINNFTSVGDLENNLHAKSENELTIEIKGEGVKNLDTLINNLSEEASKVNAIVNLNSIIELFKSLNSFNKIDEKVKDNVENLNKALNSVNDDLRNLIQNVANITKDKTIDVNLSSLSDIIDTIMKILEIDSSKINLSGLYILVSITDPKHGLINKLLTQLKDSTETIKFNEKVFSDLEYFFNAITSLGEIGFIKRRRIKNNIRFINKNIIDEIPLLAKRLNDVAKYQESAYTAINNLTDLFSAITEISSMKLNDRIRLLINLKFIKDIYLKQIVDILEYFKNVINGDFISVNHALESINKVFEMILQIGDMSMLKIMKISFKTDAVIDIIEDSIESLMEIIANVKGTKNAVLKIMQIQSVFSALTNIYQNTPKIKSSLLESLKIQMIIENISMISDLIELTNNLQKIKTQKIFDKQLPELIESIYLIFGEDNFSNVIRKLNDLNDTIIFFNEKLIVNLDKTLTKINELPEIINGKKSIRSLKTILNEFDETKEGSIGALLAYMPKTGYEVISEIGNQLKSFTDVITNFNTIDKDQIDNIKTLLKVTKTIVSQFNTEDENTIAAILEKSDIETPEKINDIATSMKPFVDVITHFDTLTKEQIGNIRSLLKVTKTIVSQFEKKDQTIAYYLDKTNIKTIETLDAIGVALKTLSANLADVKIINKDQQKNLKALIKVTNTIVAQFDSKDPKSIAAHLKGVDKKDIEKLDTMITLIKKLSTLNKIKIVLNISAKAIKEFTKIANPLKTFIDKLASVKNNDIKQANKVINSFIKIVVGGAAILLLGGLVMGLVKPANLVLFTLALGAFLLTLGGIFWAVNKAFKNTMAGARNAMIIVSVGAAVMILGSWLTSRKFFGGALIFTFELGIFLTTIGLVFWLVSRGFKRTMKGARNAMYIVGAAALVLILGSIAHNWYNFGNALLFTIELGLFLLALGGVFYLITPLFKGTYRSMKRALKLVVMSSLIMIGAQLIYGFLDSSKIFGFVLILSGFLLAIGLAFKLTHKLIKQALGSVLLLTIVTALAAAVLFFVGYLTKQHPEMLLCALGFALALVGYLAIIGLGFKFMKKLIPYIVIGAIVMTGIMLVTLIAVGVMYLMYAVCKQPDFFSTIMWGLLSMGIVFVAFGGLMMLLGWLLVGSVGIGAGLLAVGAIALIQIMGVVALASLTMALMYWACSDYDFFDVITNGLMAMGWVFGGFIALICVLGLLMYTGIGAALFAGGVAALLILEGVVGLAAVVIMGIAKAVKSLKDVSVSKGDLTRMEDTVTGFANVVILIIDKMPWNPLKIAKLVAITAVMHKASNAISAIARGIKEFSTMKFASEFDSKGNPKKYISITNADFPKAVQRIEQVLTCVSNGLLSVAKKHPNLFNEGLFTKSQAYNAMKVATKMGDALGSIAKGLKDWVEMRFVLEYDDKGNPKKWGSLSNSDLTRVADNIKLILTALGDAIISTAAGNEKIFGSRWYDGILGNDTPAMNAVKCIQILGSVLNETASVVFAYSEGLLPVYDKDGHILSRDQWQKLDLEDLKSKKGSRIYNTIKTILCALGDSISAVAEDPEVKDLFDTSFLNRVFGGGEGVNVATAIRDMASGLNQTIDVITKIQEMNLDGAPEKLEKVKQVLGKSIKAIIGVFEEFQKEDNTTFKTRDITMGDDVIEGAKNNAKKALGKTQDWFADSWLGKGITSITGKDLHSNYRKGIKQTKANFTQYIKDNIESIQDTAKNLNEFLDAICGLTENVVSFSKNYEDNKKYFDSFESIDLNKYVNQVIAKIKAAANIDASNLNIEKTSETINKINNAVDSILGGIVSLIKKYSDEAKELTNYEANDISGVVKDFLNSINEIKNISINDFNSLDTNQFKTSQEKMNAVITIYNGTFDKISNIMQRIKSIRSENYDILKNGIFSIFETTEELDNDVKFSKYVDDLERFINTINSVKLSNLSEFKKVVESMNSLTSELTNMDSLTDAISNKLSMVLYELVVQLRKAEATIDNAHNLQEKRKQLMDTSISKIQSIMDKHMIVEITQAGSNNRKNYSNKNSNSSAPQQVGTINNTPVYDNTPVGTDETISNESYEQLNNPENTEAATGIDKNTIKKQPDASQLKDVLTFGKFKQYMEQTYLNKIRNSG